MSKYKVFSMFDGVGGFVVGLNAANKSLGKDIFEVTDTNQFEPSRKSQDAFEVGVYNYPEISHSNEDIMIASEKYFSDMKSKGVNMIVGGFPCQDYSVARSKKHEKGIEGKKGVLFWEIIRAVKQIQPDYLILENVDRLLKSPSKQRGRDFAIMLGAFNQLGYIVEWRVINAADYGASQRRRRVFFFIYKTDSEFATNYVIADNTAESFERYIFEQGLFARQFPIEKEANKKRIYSNYLSEEDVHSDEYIVDISNNFTGQVWNTGIMKDGFFYTVDTIPKYEKAKTLGEVVEEAKQYYVEQFGEKAYEEYINQYIIKDEEKIKKFQYLRGPKKIERTSSEGFKYIFSEGGMSETDELSLPGRTMLTSEGSVNRSTHFLKHGDGFRLLTPIEAELLQDFPCDWTKYKSLSDGTAVEVADRMRYFFMGNALVTSIVKRIALGMEN